MVISQSTSRKKRMFFFSSSIEGQAFERRDVPSPRKKLGNPREDKCHIFNFSRLHVCKMNFKFRSCYSKKKKKDAERFFHESERIFLIPQLSFIG